MIPQLYSGGRFRRMCRITRPPCREWRKAGRTPVGAGYWRGRWITACHARKWVCAGMGDGGVASDAMLSLPSARSKPEGAMPHVFPVRVYYEDTDMAAVVYHVNYFKFIERARSDWVREKGLDQNAMRKAGIVFMVRRIEADYLAAAQYDDALEVVTEVKAMTGVRLVMTQEVLRGRKPLFRAEVTAVCATLRGQPTRLPDELRRGVS